MVEATSGNTGIGLAMVCAFKGYPLVVTMADSFSIERRKLMRFFGAKVVLTPRAEKGFGMYQKAKELAEANGWFLARQFETDVNAKIHENTTAREILSDFEGDRLDYWVTGYGTGGTVTGVGRVLRKKRPDTKIILSEPANAQLLGSGQAQERSADGSPAVSHSAFEPHPIQGWTPDFIPLVLQESIDDGLYDEVIPVPGPVGIEWSQKLAQSEGIFAGISGGSTFAIAMQIAEKAEAGSVILCMLPDTGERYLSSPSVRDDRRGNDRGRNRAFAVYTGIPYARCLTFVGGPCPSVAGMTAEIPDFPAGCPPIAIIAPSRPQGYKLASEIAFARRCESKRHHRRSGDRHRHCRCDHAQHV